MDSPLIPSFFPLQPDDPVVLLPLRLVMMGSSVESSAPGQSSILITPGDQRLSQWGLGQGTHESALLSPTEEAQ